MKRLGFALLLIVIMLPLVPFSKSMALLPLESHISWKGAELNISPLIYMFGHANLLHWAINSWCVLMLHNTFRLHRVVASYLSSILFGLGWMLFASASSSPVVGFSVILFWFYGYLIPYYWHKERTNLFFLSLFLGVGLVLPNIAGFFHLSLLVVGFLYYQFEAWYYKAWNFLIDHDE